MWHKVVGLHVYRISNILYLLCNGHVSDGSRLFTIIYLAVKTEPDLCIAMLPLKILDIACTCSDNRFLNFVILIRLIK